MKVYNENSLVNLSNSILKHFCVETFHNTIPEIDELLKGHKKVVAVLFDGMGQNIVRKQRYTVFWWYTYKHVYMVGH